jgi:hypothetical protein
MRATNKFYTKMEASNLFPLEDNEKELQGGTFYHPFAIIRTHLENRDQ